MRPTDPAPSSGSGANRADSRARGVRVLVVDDEPDVRDVLVFVLEDEGYSVVAVDSGERALEEARRTPFDVVITDYRMPGWNGLETLVALKALAPELPVVIATGCPSTSLEASCLGAGAFECLWKPFGYPELFDVLRRALVRS